MRFQKLVVVFALLAPPVPAVAQWECKEITSNEWLKQASSNSQETPIPESFVRPLTKRLAQSVIRLADRDFVRITREESARLTGRAPPPDQSLQPYVVRAVFPVANPSLRISWSGDDLHVFAAGLGCAPFVKHPIVVFLDRQPKKVFVMASAAL